MTKRHLSQTPAAIAARDRRLFRAIDQQEREWKAEIKKLMETGLSFDEAWIAGGGQIIPINSCEPEADR